VCILHLIHIFIFILISLITPGQWTASFMSEWVEEQYNGWIVRVVGVGLGSDGSWMGSRIGVGLDGGVGGVEDLGDSISFLGDVLWRKSHKDSSDVIVLGFGRFDGGLDGVWVIEIGRLGDTYGDGLRLGRYCDGRIGGWGLGD